MTGFIIASEQLLPARLIINDRSPIISDMSLERREGKNLRDLEGAIPLLNRRLLYGNPQPQEELQGYGFLRGLAAHPDAHIKSLAQDALNARWGIVGFYYRRDQIKAFPYFFDEVKRPTFNPILHSLPNTVKIAIVELARRFGESDVQPIPVAKFGEVISPLVGPWTDPKHILESLGELYVLTDEAQYVPLVKVKRGRLRLGQAAQRVLAPHISVLEAISYPKTAIAVEDLNLVRAVGNSIDRAFRAGTLFFRESNIAGLTMREDEQPVIPNLTTLELELAGELRSTRFEEDKISFLDKQGRLHTLTHTDTIPESVRVLVTEQPFDARTGLLLDFRGRQVRGKEIGSLEVFANTIEARGVLIPELPEGLQDAAGIKVSEREMSVIWEVFSGRVKSAFELKFSTGQKGRETYVSGTPSTLIVPASNKYRTPKKKAEVEDAGFKWSGTAWKEVALDKLQEVLEIRHPKGNYSIAYKTGEDFIEIVFKGRNWEKTLVIPRAVDPAAVAQSMEQQVASILDRVQSEREAIRVQAAAAHRMGLAEYDMFAKLVDIKEPELREYIKQRLSKSELHRNLRAIDEELAKLDPKNQWVARVYVQEVFKRGPLRVGKEEEPRTIMESLIRQYNLNIPDKLLELCESVFLPKS